MYLCTTRWCTPHSNVFLSSSSLSIFLSFCFNLIPFQSPSLPTRSLSVCLSVCLSLSVSLFLSLSLSLYIYIYIYISVSPYIFIYQTCCLHVYHYLSQLTKRFSYYLSIYLSICLYIYLSLECSFMNYYFQNYFLSF